MGELTTREADATFAELICADPQWLRAEFDALITAGFGTPPAWPRPPAPPRVPPSALPPARLPRPGTAPSPSQPSGPRGQGTAASARPPPCRLA
jgi:hypothetical protein